MNVQVLRFSHGPADTIGLLNIGPTFCCFTLEDEYRAQKVYAETRIPYGNYQLGLRTTGNMNERYRERFGSLHQGMIWILDVPDFEWCYFHTGIHHRHTAGCILVGDTLTTNVTEEGSLGHSSQAYRRFYNQVVQSVKEGNASLTIAPL